MTYQEYWRKADLEQIKVQKLVNQAIADLPTCLPTGRWNYSKPLQFFRQTANFYRNEKSTVCTVKLTNGNSRTIGFHRN
ncbi:MAG: hypothetical protein FWG64_01435 [Firmicutes bacterium]|nr:hypothetical protein [Bacillota bacterium]